MFDDSLQALFSFKPKCQYLYVTPRPTWFFITTVMLANTEILNYVDFYSHNDMDMMEIGNGELSIYEQRTHFAVWAFMKSPILLGTNVRLRYLMHLVV